jgi:hypothetical protein
MLATMIRRVLAMGVGLLMIATAAAVAPGQGSRSGMPAPELGTGPWINSAPLTMAGLRGRVVLVEFWTYG